MASIPSAWAANVVMIRCVSTGCGDGFNIFKADHVAARERRARLGTEDQILNRARTGAPGDERLQPRRSSRVRRPRLPHQPGRVRINVIGHGHPPHELLLPDNILAVQELGQLRQLVTRRRSRDPDFFLLGGIIQLDQEHEAVQLGFRQRIRSFLFDRILRGQHQEGRLQSERLAHHRDLLLLHRFQHGGLRLRRSAVDLVGQDHVGEDRTMHKFELAAAACLVLQDVRPGDVHRHQVGGELDPAELQRHRLRELPDQ